MGARICGDERPMSCVSSTTSHLDSFEAWSLTEHAAHPFSSAQWVALLLPHHWVTLFTIAGSCMAQGSELRASCLSSKHLTEILPQTPFQVVLMNKKKS